MASRTGEAWPRPAAVVAAACALVVGALAAPLSARDRSDATAIPAVATDPDIIRIPVPVPVPMPARRRGAPPMDDFELQAWREERAEFLARVRMASLPAPAPAPGVLVDVSIVPPMPHVAKRPLGPAFIIPFENGRITSMFNRGRVHPAIDLAGRLGSPVMATSAGQTVTFAGGYGGYGLAVITRDRDGRVHLYGHLSAINTRAGATLTQGERLGALGSTGFSTGPHVHYEVKDANGRHIDPATLLFPGRTVTAGFTWQGTGLQGSTFAAAERN